MAKYEIGDKVRIKEGLIHDHDYGDAKYIDRMYYPFPVTIRSFLDFTDARFYYIAECPHNWLYSSEMFESDNNVDKKSYLKVNKNSKHVQFNFNN